MVPFSINCIFNLCYNDLSTIIRAQCEAEIKGFAQAKYRKFSTKEEAENFVESNGSNHSQFSNPSNNLTTQCENGPNQKSSKETYYAVAKGKKVGIYTTW